MTQTGIVPLSSQNREKRDMKDKRGVTIAVDQTVLFSQKTGSFGAHTISEGHVQNITPKMVCLSYVDAWDNKTVVEGHYYPNRITVVNLPNPD